MNSNRREYIISAELSKRSWFVNNDLSMQLYYQLEALGLMVTGCQGFYEGVSELSVIVTELGHENLRELLLNIAQDYGQECILVKEPKGSTYLISNDWDKDTYIGEMRAVPEPVAKLQAGYTLVNNTYYITQSFEKKGV